MTNKQTSNAPNMVLVATGTALVSILATVALLSWVGWLAIPQADQQTMIHDMGNNVMPFNLGDTTHIFEMTENGGVQQVIANDPNDVDQIALIRQHLQHESMRFSSGDFSDPTSLHGSDMPGINELVNGIDQVIIEYSDLPDGAQITFTSQDINLITAIHRWFGAQLSDHGEDATYR